MCITVSCFQIYILVKSTRWQQLVLFKTHTSDNANIIANLFFGHCIYQQLFEVLTVPLCIALRALKSRFSWQLFRQRITRSLSVLPFNTDRPARYPRK